MSYSYTYNVEYEIFRYDREGSFMDTISSTEHKFLMKNNKDLLKQGLKDLSSDFMFGGENMTPDEYKKHLEKCLIKGAVEAKIKYYLSGYAKCTFIFDHELSAKEKLDLDDAVEGQKVDGYGESLFFLIDNGTHYYLGLIARL